mgnify:FL=1
MKETELQDKQRALDGCADEQKRLEKRLEDFEAHVAALESKNNAQQEVCITLQKELSKLDEIDALNAKLADANLETAKREKDLQDQKLLIGKLRHEAVILNDHLTNALKYVRSTSRGSTVDKDLVSNLILQYTTCKREDTKKYEILMLIANFMDWDDQQRQLAGLQRSVNPEQDDTPPQMVGVVGKLAEFIERAKK